MEIIHSIELTSELVAHSSSQGIVFVVSDATLYFDFVGVLVNCLLIHSWHSRISLAYFCAKLWIIVIL